MKIKQALFIGIISTSTVTMAFSGDYEPRCSNPQTHQDYLAKAKAGNIDIAHFGGSFTYGWEHSPNGKKLWPTLCPSLKSAQFGLPGEASWGILWRLQNGELDGFKAKVVVLFSIGGNDVRGKGAPAEVTIKNTQMCIDEVRKHQPQASILIVPIPDMPTVTAILKPTNSANGQYNVFSVVNKATAAMADNKQVFYLKAFQDGLDSKSAELAEEMKKIMSGPKKDPHDTKIMYDLAAAGIHDALEDILAHRSPVRGATDTSTASAAK